MLDEALNRMLTRRLPDGAARSAEGLSQSLMLEMIAAGFTRVLASEDHGGLDGTMADAASVAWRCGWHAAPVPVVEMLLLAYLDPDADPKNVTLAHGSPAIAPALPGVRRIHTGKSVETTTTARPFRHISGAQWLRLEGHAASHDIATNAMGEVLTAAAMTGAMARVLEIISGHAATRTQFGRPLAGFQAVQHQLAEATSELSVTEAALAGAIEPHGAAWLATAVKAQAGTAATRVAATAHQVMGAIGFTEDHELHHFTKLLWQWRDSWGRQADCEIAIGHAACAAEGGLWAHITETKKEDK